MRKKDLFILAMVALIMATIPTGYAANSSSALMSTYSSIGSENNITPCADVIVYKYRLLNGEQQYRRWNETRGYWVDPYWLYL